MGVSVLMVAEKPSLAQSIAHFLSNGQVKPGRGIWEEEGSLLCQ